MTMMQPTRIIPRFRLNNVTPFTYRDGLTFLQILEALRDKIDQLVANDDELIESYNNLVETLNETIERFYVEFDEHMEDSTEVIRGLVSQTIDAVNDALGAVDDAQALLADMEEISGLTGEDEAVAFLVESVTSRTHTALRPVIADTEGAVFEVGNHPPATETRHGVPVVWLDTTDEYVAIPDEPTWYGRGSMRIPHVTGIEYLIDGEVVEPGLHAAPHTGLSIITARPLPGVRTEGRSQWVRDFVGGRPIVADDFTGVAARVPISGKPTTRGNRTWRPPAGIMESFADTTTGLQISDPPGNPAKLTVYASGGSHNTLDIGYTDYRMSFRGGIAFTEGSRIGVNVRGTMESGETGVSWRWAYRDGDGLVSYRRIDGENVTTVQPQQPTSGLSWTGPVVVTVQGDQISISVTVGDITWTDSVTYTGNPGSSLIRLAAARHFSTSVFPSINNFEVLPL